MRGRLSRQVGDGEGKDKLGSVGHGVDEVRVCKVAFGARSEVVGVGHPEAVGVNEAIEFRRVLDLVVMRFCVLFGLFDLLELVLLRPFHNLLSQFSGIAFFSVKRASTDVNLATHAIIILAHHAPHWLYALHYWLAVHH